MDRLLRPVRQRGAAFSRTTPPLGKYCFSAVKAVTAVQRTEILGFGTGETGLSRTRPLHHRRGRWPPWDMTPLWETCVVRGIPRRIGAYLISVIPGCGTELHGRRTPAGALWLRYGLRSFTGGFDLRWPRHIRQRYLERYVVAYTVRPETREPIAIFPGGRKCLVSRKGTPKLPTARARPHHACLNGRLPSTLTVNSVNSCDSCNKSSRRRRTGRPHLDATCPAGAPSACGS